MSEAELFCYRTKYQLSCNLVMNDEFPCCSSLLRLLIAPLCIHISTNWCLHLLLYSLLKEENKGFCHKQIKLSFVSCLFFQELKYYSCILVRTVIRCC